ncbi:MAG: hypothetical protein EBX52_04870 [Proteobacteria bacterium]|nr:hypothetical protein [Pseudomonadota bacterium]
MRFGWVLALVSSGAFAQVNGSDLARITAPESDRVGVEVPGDVLGISALSDGFTVDVHETDRRIFGFSFFNEGVNAVIPVSASCIGCGLNREFRFRFRDRARQDLHFSITDAPTEYLSQLMESYFYVFPRKNLPAAELIPERGILRVTLPTGETVDFDSAKKTVVGGVLVETGPIDLNPDRFSRKFAQVSYLGDGVLVRVNRRGADPRLGTVATVTKGKKSCKIESKYLFNQDEKSSVEFLFPTDEGFNDFLLKRCGFGEF